MFYNTSTYAAKDYSVTAIIIIANMHAGSIYVAKVTDHIDRSPKQVQLATGYGCVAPAFDQ